jgi:membrane protease YdiL (CAAX protease family)
MGPSKAITFRSILPALVFIVALNLSHLILKGPARNTILAYGHLWNAMFLAFPLAHVIARRASLRELGYRGRNPLRLYARGAALGAVWRFFDILTSYYGVFTFPGTTQFLTGLLRDLTLAPLFEDTFFRAYLQVGLEERLGAVGAIVVQALLFATHPGHAVQGWQHFPAMFLFGLIAGLIYWRTRSIVPLFGAHGVANALPSLVAMVAQRW